MCHMNTYSQNEINKFKLKCKVKVEYSHSNGHKEVNDSELILSVFEVKKDKYVTITTKSSNINADSISVTTQKSSQQQIRRPQGFEIFVIDSSDENNFDITNFNDYPGNRKQDIIFFLSRNTGEIIVSNEFTSPDGSKLQTSIGGTCEKINTNKKKF